SVFVPLSNFLSLLFSRHSSSPFSRSPLFLPLCLCFPDEGTVLTPAFTNSVRRYRQAQEHYGSWDLMCGKPPQILANLVMEELHPDLRSVIGPKLKGKLQQRQRSWMLISGAVYRQVLTHTISHYEALVQGHEAQRGPLDAALRTDMDQIINSKEHVSGKIKAVVLPKVEQVLKSSVEPYVSSILDALMVPTSRGFSEVREVFSRELVELSKNSVEQDQDKLGELMERMSMLAFHPVKMHSCYDELERLELEGLQQRFSVSGPRVFSCRAQILLREQMDNAVYTFEQLLNQSLQAPGESDLCKSIQKCQERVLKKFDYDSSTVRKKFFREALLQIIVPYMLQQLAPSCVPELPRFQELIFEDFSRFLLVEDLYEEVIIQSVSKDIMSAVKEAAVQRRHNLYRDSIVLTNSDPNLHLLGEEDQVDWRSKFSVKERSNSGTKRNQVVSMIQLEGVPLPYESCLEVPGEDLIPEEEDSLSSQEEDVKTPINQIRDLIHPVVELVVPASDQEEVASGTESKTGLVVMEDGIQEEVTHVTTKLDKPTLQIENFMDSTTEKEEAAIKSAIHELEIAVQDEEDSDQNASGPDSDSDLVQPQRLQTTVYSSHNDSGFQSPTNERPESARTRPISNGQEAWETTSLTLFQTLSSLLWCILKNIKQKQKTNPSRNWGITKKQPHDTSPDRFCVTV
uniref:Niban 1/2/3 domain-containing protein n=1 Tax=Periophthalmus magnuspinnatus TaxID=409849 RepID=A0A3B4B0P4_9GOBI